jgi:amino acid adenylation domain-containing protein
MQVQAFLTQTALRLPHKVALVCDQQRLTYAELEERSNRLGNALVLMGLQRGERVGLHLANSVEAVVSLFAILKAGGTFVAIPAATRPAKLEMILNDCRAAALFMDTRAGAGDLRRAVPSLRWVIPCGAAATTATDPALTFEAIQASASAAPLEPVGIDLDLACLVYTSGSTGEAKGVMCDHSAMSFVSQSIMSFLGTRESDIVFCALPLAFDYGLYQLLMTFLAGGTLVLERSFGYPAQVLRRIQEERVTGLPGVPTLFALLLQMDLGPYDLASVRYLTNTAAALSPRTILALQAAFPGATLFSMYGLTETKRTLYLPPEHLALRPGSVGIPIPGTEAWLEDEAGRRLGPGATGELVVRGRHVMRGYWEAPEATALRFRPGAIPGERVCHTGDLFRTDAEGYFYFVSRRDDIIKCCGEKVAPAEVENVLQLLPGVTAAVIGVADALAGQVVKAFIVNRGAILTPAQVLAHCRAHLEPYMVPRFLAFREDLPMTASGKISKLGLE